jgi:hypothetical protein
MACGTTSTGCGFQSPDCPTRNGCPPGVTPDFQINRNDTMPPLKLLVTDANGDSIDFTGLVIEANMWISSKLKTSITETDTTIALADNIGFEQILPNDVIVMNRARNPEHMRIIGFDEDNSLIFVERGFNNTTPASWKRGSVLQIFRIINGPAQAEMIFEDVQQVDGTLLCNQLIESFLVYEWMVNDTCVAGCYRFEFKVLKMSGSAVVPSVTPMCFLGVGVEWIQRYPTCCTLLIRICESPTSELLIIPSTT